MKPTFPVLVALVLGTAACRVPYPDAPRYRPESLGGSPAARDATRPLNSPASDAPDPDGLLTLEDCLRIAHRNNRRLWISDRRILITKDRVNEALSRLIPRLNVETRWNWRSNDMGISAEGREFVMGERDTGTAKIGLLVPIYSFGRALIQLDVEGKRVEASEKDAERARQELTLAVSQTYFRLLEAQRIREVVQESLKVVRRQGEVSRDFLAQGLVARSDVLSTEVQLADRQQALIRAENNIHLARATLNRLMGIDLVRPTEVEDVLDAAPWTGPLQTVLRLAIDRRPDLAALRHLIEAGRAEYDVIQRGNLPLIAGTVDYNATTDDAMINKDWLSAAVILQIPLMDGFQTQFRLRRKKKEIAEAIDFHDERLDDILLDVTRAYLMVRDASERLPVARKSIALAEENLRVTRDQYAEGLVTSADLLAEEERLSQARANRVRALYEYHASVAQLENATGGPLPKD